MLLMLVLSLVLLPLLLPLLIVSHPQTVSHKRCCSGGVVVALVPLTSVSHNRYHTHHERPNGKQQQSNLFDVVCATRTGDCHGLLVNRKGIVQSSSRCCR